MQSKYLSAEGKVMGNLIYVSRLYNLISFSYKYILGNDLLIILSSKYEHCRNVFLSIKNKSIIKKGHVKDYRFWDAK
jgi:hypothetical protein